MRSEEPIRAMFVDRQARYFLEYSTVMLTSLAALVKGVEFNRWRLFLENPRKLR